MTKHCFFNFIEFSRKKRLEKVSFALMVDVWNSEQLVASLKDTYTFNQEILI